MCLSVYVHLSGGGGLSLCVRLSWGVCLSVSGCLSVEMFLSVCVCLSLFAHLSVFLSCKNNQNNARLFKTWASLNHLKLLAEIEFEVILQSKAIESESKLSAHARMSNTSFCQGILYQYNTYAPKLQYNTNVIQMQY